MDEETRQKCQINMGRLLSMVSHEMKRHNLSPSGDSGLTSMQRNVLGFILIGTMHREIYQKDLEEEFHIRKSTATGILQLMEKKGFIVRKSVKSDARLKSIVPTPKAEAYRGEVLANIHNLECRLAQNIPEEDYEICRRVLWQMFRNLKQTEEENN